MPSENGEISGFVKLFYGVLVALAVGTGMYLIITGLVADGGFFDVTLDAVLDTIKTKIINQLN